MDVQRSLSDIYNKCDLAHDTRSQLGAQEALQRAHRMRNARVCKKRNKGVHLGLDPVRYIRAPHMGTGCRCTVVQVQARVIQISVCLGSRQGLG